MELFDHSAKRDGIFITHLMRNSDTYMEGTQYNTITFLSDKCQRVLKIH
jgi:hypothetical protein